MTVGIEKMRFATSNLYLDMTDLAHARGEDPNKYLLGIGQTEQAVVPPSQDAVTLAANAAEQLLTKQERAEIAEIIVATESGVDHSKSVAIYVQRLLELNRYARAIELKQACYSGTFGLMQARDYVSLHPDKKVLVIATDIARYGLNTSGEVTQGAGAVAMLVSANPQIAVINDDSQFMTADIMDFWRPVDHDKALVDGKYSANVYRDFFKEVWQRYQDTTGLTLTDFDAMVFHLPFTKMGLKALRDVLPETDEAHAASLLAAFEASRVYSKRVGNLYTGSLYLSLLSLLANDTQLRGGQRIGMFSYGSGAEGEFFSLTLAPTFKAGLDVLGMEKLLDQRQQLSVPAYEELFEGALWGSANQIAQSEQDPAHFVLTGVQNQQRQYRRQTRD